MTIALRLAATSLLATLFAMPAAEAAVVNLDTGTAGSYDIQSVAPGLGSEGPVTLNWDPLSDPGTSLTRWGDSDYSGRHAAFCSAGVTTACALDLTVAPTHSVTLSSFFLGAWPDTDRMITWSVIDLATSNPIAGGADAFVSGVTGLVASVSATSTAGFRILFGPDGFNGGINDITYSYTRLTPPPSAVPLPAGGWLMLAGVGGLAAMRRRRRH